MKGVTEMKHHDRFAWLLDRLSGTYPNDERTSHINEKGFALIGLLYIPAFAVRGICGLFVNRPRWGLLSRCVSGALDLPLLLIMLLILFGITVKQRRSEEPISQKPHRKIRLTELPAAAAAVLSGKSPEDERTVRAYERGFAVCALLGLAYLLFSMLLTVFNAYFLSTSILLCAAPLILYIVKLLENILTPPRFAHIRLNTKHLLLRLPVYTLAVVPYLAVISFLPHTYDMIGNMMEPDIYTEYSDNLAVMFLQFCRASFMTWIHHPLPISVVFLYYAALIYLAVVLFHEVTVWIYKRQMQKMDAEENDLT